LKIALRIVELVPKERAQSSPPLTAGAIAGRIFFPALLCQSLTVPTTISCGVHGIEHVWIPRAPPAWTLYSTPARTRNRYMRQLTFVCVFHFWRMRPWRRTLM